MWRRIRAMGWGVLLLPVALLWFALSGPSLWSIGILVLAGTAAVLAPSLAADRIPLALLLLGMCAIIIAFAVLNRHAPINVSVVPARLPRPPAVPPRLAPPPSPGDGRWLGNLLILPEVCLILAFGLWLIPRTLGADIWTVKRTSGRSRGWAAGYSGWLRPARTQWTAPRPNCGALSGICTMGRRPGWSRSG